jgi:hypothetical protein
MIIKEKSYNAFIWRITILTLQVFIEIAFSCALAKKVIAPAAKRRIAVWHTCPHCSMAA